MTEIHYNAFISYRHTERDTTVAAEIQKRLEHFHIPSALREKYGVDRIGRVFRDQDELVISENLGGVIDQALGASDWLIVICSPAYPESSWCLHEIEEFLRTHDRSHILTVLSEGEPPEVFPEILRRRTETMIREDGSTETVETLGEPLACDYRGDIKKANRTELPRLVSALIGCGYDELIMRDTQYRRRRMTAFFSVFALLAAGAVSYLLYSNHEIQRHYRETLIAQSGNLAEQSQQALDAGDRYAAMRYAAEAMPSAELDRPVIGEALQALSRSVYAYGLPYTIAETECYDLDEDIREMILSDDGQYLLVRDNTEILRVFETESGTKCAELPLYTADSDVIITSDDRIVTMYDGTARAYDMNGNLLQEMPMKYRLYNFLRESPDGRYIGCGDSFAIQVMNSEDLSPEASFPLPERIDGYIRDFTWSEDGRKMAAVVRQEGGPSTIAVYDFETGKIREIPGVYMNIRSVLMTADEVLYIAADETEDSSFTASDGTEYLYECIRTVTAVSGDSEILWTAEIRFTAMDRLSDMRMMEQDDGKVLLVTAGDHLCLIDPADGHIITDRQTGDSPVAVVEAAGAYIHAVTAGGKDALVNTDTGEVLLEQVFPRDIDGLAVVPAPLYLQNRYYVLKDGNVMVFESFHDRSLVLYAGEAFTGLPEDSLVLENRLLVKTGGQITVYDTESRSQICRTVMAQDEAPVLLGRHGNSAVFLVIHTETGDMEAVRMDPDTGMITERYPLHIRDYYCEEGILDIYAEMYGGDDPLSVRRQVLDAQYRNTHQVVLSDGRIWYHGYEEPDVIRCLDLNSGEISVLTPDLSPAQHLMTGQYAGDLSGIAVSGNGKIWMNVRENGHELRSVLIDEKSGESRIIEESAGGVLKGVWNNDGTRCAMSGSGSLIITGHDGSVLSEIPYAGRSVLAMTWLSDDTLILCCPDGTLVNTDMNGEILHKVKMSYTALRFVDASSFRFAEVNGYLAVFCQDTLEMIGLSEWLSRPSVSALQQVLNYLPDTDGIVVYSYMAGDPMMRRFIGVFPCRTAEELTDMAEAQMADMIRGR